MSKELKKIEDESNERIKKLRTIILPSINLVVIPLSYFLLHCIDSLNIVESIMLAFAILGINLHILSKATIKKENTIQDFIYEKILPSIFDKFFTKHEIKRNEGMTVKDTKKSDLLSIESGSIFEKEDYMKFEFNTLDCEMSDVRNSVNAAEYHGSTIDCGILVKIKTTKNNFKFVVRDIGKFDYKKEYFMKEKIDLYETKNEEFDKHYACYTNDSAKMKEFLDEDRINYLLDVYKTNRIEVSNNGTELFIFANNLSLDFDNQYDEEYYIDMDKIKTNSEESLNKITTIINKLDI
jgi:hypothetical protein